MTRLERMVTRARLVRAYYELREKADEAATLARDYHDAAKLARECEDIAGEAEAAVTAEFHSGRHCGMLTALGILDQVLADAD